jgi:tetratricopeptide (TPR) repeat protein
MRRVSVLVVAPWLLAASHLFSSVIAVAPEGVLQEQPAAGQTPTAEGPAVPQPPAPAEVSPEEAAARRKAAEAELETAKGFTKGAWRAQWSDGIEIGAMLEAAGRRFIAGPSGLHEFDATGRIMRSWWSAHSITPAGVRHSVDVPPTAPVYSDDHVVAGDLIYSADQQKTVAYRPATDTWYGPLLVSIGHAPCGTRDGVWGGNLNGIGYVRNEDFLAKAEAMGRVMTTAEFLVRRDALVEALPALERAKVYFAMRRFDEAEALLEEIARAEPRHAEALLLLGWLNDAWCTNRPDDARRYYRRLAAMEDDPNVCFSGHYMEFLMLGREKQWKELIEAGDRMVARFPQIEDQTQGNIDWWREHARKQLAEAE